MWILKFAFLCSLFHSTSPVLSCFSSFLPYHPLIPFIHSVLSFPPLLSLSFFEQHILVSQKGLGSFAYKLGSLQIVTSTAAQWSESLEHSQFYIETISSGPGCTTPPLMEMSHRQPFLSPITCHWACKIHSWHSHCSSIRLNGPSCVALSFRKMMSVIVKATFKSGVGEKIMPLFFTLLLAFHLVLIVMHDWLDWRNKLSLRCFGGASRPSYSNYHCW